jgi:hypothetical protein
MQVAMQDGVNGYGVMGINIQPSFPTGATMDKVSERTELTDRVNGQSSRTDQ